MLETFIATVKDMVKNEQKSTRLDAGKTDKHVATTRKKIRPFLLFFEGVLICFVLALLAAMVLIWRIHDAPLDVSFAKTRVEEALNDPTTDRYLDIGSIKLHWAKFSGPLLLGIDQIRLKDNSGNLIASVDEAAVGLVKSALFLGQIAPEIIILREPSLRVVRSVDGEIDYGFETTETGVATKSEDAIQDIVGQLLGGKNATAPPAVLQHLDAFKIEGAKLVFEGQKNDIDLLLPDFNITFSNPDHSNLTGLLIEASQGSFRYGGIYSKPLEFKDVSVRAVYDSEARTFSLSQANIVARGVAIKAVADIRHDDKSAGGAVRVSIDNVRQDQIGPLWPESLENENSFKWIVERMSDGVFNNASLDMKLIAHKEQEAWFFDVKDIVGRWDFENLTVNYRAPLPPVKQARGYGVFDNIQEKIDVYIHDGKIGGLDITKAELEFANIIAAGKGRADINIKLSGPLTEVFDYVAQEPIAAPQDFDLAKVKGQVDATVNIVFPTVSSLKKEDIHLYVVGQADDAALPGVVGDLSLTAGSFNVKIKDNLLRVSGDGLLDGQAVNARYESFLNSEGRAYKSRIKAKTKATEAMRQKLGIDLSDFISGPANIDVIYTQYHDSRSEAEIDVDLRESRLFVQPFDYTKPEGVQGKAALVAKLQDGNLRSIKSLNANAPDFLIVNGDLAFRSDNGKPDLAGGRASRFKVLDSEGSIEFEVLPSGLVKIVIAGPVLDIRPFLEDEKEAEGVYSEPPMRISVSADKMIPEDGEFVTNAKLYLDIDAQGHFNQLEMDAIAGNGDIYLRFKPDAQGVRTFRLEADDAGATLRAFGLYKNLVGGKLNIFGEPVGRFFDRNFRGKAEISNFKVVRAPSLARLISALSLSGMASMLTEGEGLGFSKLEADFDWLFRPKGSLLVLKDGRTSGNSLGLTFDGTFDNEKNIVDVNGTIVPLSGVNKAIGSIPIVGDLLTGGGALIAATYSLKGPSSDPKVLVNPLSVLTPGILRKILFEQN